MPIIPSKFRPPWCLANGHLQTILPALLPRRVDACFTREQFELPDGDFLALDWLRGGFKRLAILSHGLEGASSNGYMRGASAALQRSGWDVLAWNFRGCGGRANRLLRFYHSGDTGDLRALVEEAAKKYPRIALVGFSLGGNVTLKYLGESPPHPNVIAGVGISVPINLEASSHSLDTRWMNSIYLRRFMRTLTAKVEAKAKLFPGRLDTTELGRIRTFAQFDDRYTAPLHGFAGARDYWTRSSSRQFLRGIAVPTLLLNARNDPFLTPECFPFSEAHLNSTLYLEAPASGGHVGFLDRHFRRWGEQRIVEFLSQYAAPAKTALE